MFSCSVIARFVFIFYNIDLIFCYAHVLGITTGILVNNEKNVMVPKVLIILVLVLVCSYVLCISTGTFCIRGTLWSGKTGLYFASLFLLRFVWFRGRQLSMGCVCVSVCVWVAHWNYQRRRQGECKWKSIMERPRPYLLSIDHIAYSPQPTASVFAVFPWLEFCSLHNQT